MDSLKLNPRPGKTAPRLIHDLLDYDPRSGYQRKSGTNLLTDASPWFRQDGPLLPARLGASDCHHTLIHKSSTFSAPLSDDDYPDTSSKYTIATNCPQCRQHFTITTDFTQQPGKWVPCQLNNDFFPMHHFQHVTSQNVDQIYQMPGVDKYNNYSESHLFRCSGPSCPAVVEIKVTAPRLRNDLLDLIQDPALVHNRGKRTIEAEPERYVDCVPLRPVQVFGNLRQYILDAKAAKHPSELRRIAARNKKFVLAFSDECDRLLTYLDFTHFKEENNEGEPEYYWQLPLITERNREFFEDILLELDALIASTPQEQQKSLGIRVVRIGVSALKDIQRCLGYNAYPIKSRGLVDLSRDEHPYYASLGALETFIDDHLSWAYDRQCECDAPNIPYYLDCLKDLAQGRESSDLELKCAMAVSAGEVGLNEIDSAYRFLGLSPATVEGDDHIIGVYNSRIEAAPRQKEEARKSLLAISRARNSAKIEAVANDTTMTLFEALEFLSVSQDTASDSIEASAIAMALDADKSRVAGALRVIANHRNDFDLQRAASNMESVDGQPAFDIREAYTRLQLTDRNVPDETVFAYYKSLSTGAPSGSKDSYTEALRSIAMDRESNFLLRKLNDPDADVEAIPISTDQPVGLDNIGNTCYLNSLLQYYYTIRALREVVMNFEEHRMGLDEAAIKMKRVGGRAVDKSEILKAHSFVEELHNLFIDLRTAPTRSVRPTRELADLTIFSSEAKTNFRRNSITSPHLPSATPIIAPDGLPAPPPMPSRPAPVPEEDTEMIDLTGDKNDMISNASSDATLIDADHGLNIAPKDVNSTEEELILVESQDVIPVTDAETIAHIPAPERAPPVPPRNKSGLSIETKKASNAIDDDLWRFGSQQDVTEVIGNVMFRLQCAIKPTSFDEATGEQIDSIRDTFYGANAVYLRKAQIIERKVESWANLMVYPGPSGPRDIYEALDIFFDEQIVEIDKTMTPQHTSISKLPPILQIHIQRTDYDPLTQTAFKNRNPVVFPETIYLDRYMDSKDPNSMLMARRRQAWEWKAELRALEARQTALAASTSFNTAQSLIEVKRLVHSLQEEEMDDVFPDPGVSEELEDIAGDIFAELEGINECIFNLKQKLNEQFTNMNEYEYKLQTVFIHRGEAGGGHYWIYIYDFENDVWRQYNDDHVQVVNDRRQIFEHSAGSAGTPYYMVYVRSADKKELVDAIFRKVNGTDGLGSVPGRVFESEGTILEEEEDDQVQHIENAAPNKILQQPANHMDPPPYEEYQ